MPYKDHPRCISPRHADVKIWRYMDFTQFASILERGSLFFNSANSFKDPYEGSLPQQNFNLREEELEEIPEDWITELLPKFREICREYSFLNCWHINETESAGMWDLYLKADAGICIQSTYGKFVDALEESQDNVYISKVEYISYEEDRLSGWSLQSPLADTISPFIHKRQSFDHEQELRAIIHEIPWKKEGQESWITAEDIGNISLEEKGVSDNGKHVNVNLEELIENVYIAPHAPNWIKQLVEMVMETHDLDDGNVRKSNMTEDPYY